MNHGIEAVSRGEVQKMTKKELIKKTGRTFAEWKIFLKFHLVDDNVIQILQDWEEDRSRFRRILRKKGD